MASLSDDDILNAVQHKMNRDPQYRENLSRAVNSRNESWILRLVKMVIGEVAKSIISHIIKVFTGW